jgi:hypothetical protein
MLWFFAWTAVGAGYAFGVLAVLSIGVFIVAIAVVATVLLVRKPEARAGTIGLASGLGFTLLWVAFLNRAGPGTVCESTATSQSCFEAWNPWPWLAIGVGLVAVGAVWFGSSNSRSAEP